MHNPTEFTLELSQLRLAAKAWGNPTHPPVLALHGWLDNAASFDRLVPLLKNAYVVAVDLPGHGLSDHRASSPWYHYVDYLYDVLAIADTLGWPRFTLLGHSLGGAIASVLSAACPDRVEQLILIEALGPLTAEPDQALAQLYRALEQSRDSSIRPLRVFADVEEAIAARVKVNGLTPGSAETLVTRGLRAVPGGYSWSSDPRLMRASPLRYTEAEILTILKGIQAAVLLILATPAAPFLSPELMKARISAVSDIQTIYLSGNHHLHLEDPEPIANAINEFRCLSP